MKNRSTIEILAELKPSIYRVSLLWKGKVETNRTMLYLGIQWYIHIQYITTYAHIFCKSIYVYIVSLVHYFWTLFLNKSEMVAVCCILLAHLRKMSLVAPDLCSRNTMITGLEKHQLWRAALNHFQLVQDFSTPDVKTYSAAIMSCSSGELWADSTCLLGEAVEVLRLKFVVASLFFNMLYNWRLMSIHCSSRCCTVVPFFSGDSFVEQAPYVTTLQH